MNKDGIIKKGNCKWPIYNYPVHKDVLDKQRLVEYRLWVFPNHRGVIHVDKEIIQYECVPDIFETDIEELMFYMLKTKMSVYKTEKGLESLLKKIAAKSDPNRY